MVKKIPVEVVDAEIREESEIGDAIAEFFDKIWYNRHQMLMEDVRSGREKIDKDILKSARQAAKKVEDKYGIDNLGPYDDFEWGMIHGKLSALRWVFGDEWDMLDT
jgi:hypothetical protein